MLDFKVSHNITNRCFNAAFAKKAWARMAEFYSCYHEDYYEMLILHYYAKTKRIVKKALYVYEQGLGITETTKYTKEKLRKILLSIYNVDEYLTLFYKQENCLSYLPLVKKCSDLLYIDWALWTNFADFMDVFKESASYTKINEDVIVSKYIARLHEEITKYKRREKWLFPIIICCTCIFRSPKKKHVKCPANVVDATDKILKYEMDKTKISEYIYYLECELSFYKERSKYYMFIKPILKPFWHFYKNMFRR